jgi:hypothetical protein
MPKDSKNNCPSSPAPVVTYLRVREIFHDFLRYRYGEFPINLPEGSRLYAEFSMGLAENPTLYKMSYSGFSQAAYRSAFDPDFHDTPADSRGRERFLPTDDDARKLVPFVLPREVIKGGKLARTNQWWQLTSGGCTRMAKVIEAEFWAAFSEFDQRFNLYCARAGEPYNQEISIERFISMTGMDMRHEDTMARYWRKKKVADNKLFSSFSKKEHTDSLRHFLSGGK